MFSLLKIQKAILEENLEGWLFFVFQHRNEIACRLPGINKNSFLYEGDITGSEIDKYTRREIEKHGFMDFIRHKTGHSIDENDHGCGVNLDSF